jgi:hypothetical protein
MKRLITALALTAGAAGVALVPAQAATAGPPPLCSREYDLQKFPASIRAYGFRDCEGQPAQPVAVSIQRFDPASGTWKTVAVGSGEAKFNCFGTEKRTYRHAQQPDLKITANCT